MTPIAVEPLTKVRSDEEQGAQANEFLQRQRCAHEVLTVIPHLKRVIQRGREGTGFPITMQQYSVLKVLREQQYLISELADMFKVSRPTMTRIIDGLEGRRRHNTDGEDDTPAPARRAKLVERVDCADDRRLVYARITEEGAAMVTYFHDKAEESMLSVLDRIPFNELETLERALVLLRFALETED